jgi:hypothetical protein
MGDETSEANISIISKNWIIDDDAVDMMVCVQGFDVRCHVRRRYANKTVLDATGYH